MDSLGRCFDHMAGNYANSVAERYGGGDRYCSVLANPKGYDPDATLHAMEINGNFAGLREGATSLWNSTHTEACIDLRRNFQEEILSRCYPSTDISSDNPIDWESAGLYTATAAVIVVALVVIYKKCQRENTASRHTNTSCLSRLTNTMFCSSRPSDNNSNYTDSDYDSDSSTDELIDPATHQFLPNSNESDHSFNHLTISSL